jgi:hypothetical protein
MSKETFQDSYLMFKQTFLKKVDKIFLLPSNLFSLFAGSLIGTLSGLATGISTAPSNRVVPLLFSILFMILASICFIMIYLDLENIKRQIDVNKLDEIFKNKDIVFRHKVRIMRVRLIGTLIVGLETFISSVLFLIF